MAAIGRYYLKGQKTPDQRLDDLEAEMRVCNALIDVLLGRAELARSVAGAPSVAEAGPAPLSTPSPAAPPPVDSNP